MDEDSERRSTVSPRYGRREGSNPVKSIRCDDGIWEAAKRRAEADGATITRAITLFLVGYAYGALNLPTVTMEYGDETVVIPTNFLDGLDEKIIAPE
jgi:hypothetical protein